MARPAKAALHRPRQASATPKSRLRAEPFQASRSFPASLRSDRPFRFHARASSGWSVITLSQKRRASE